MSYQIQYNPDFWKDRPQKKTDRNDRRMINKWGAILCVAAIVASLLYGEQIKEFMIPGDPTVTTAAVDHLRENLKEGQKVKEALTEFCLEMWDYEQAY